MASELNVVLRSARPLAWICVGLFVRAFGFGLWSTQMPVAQISVEHSDASCSDQPADWHDRAAATVPGRDVVLKKRHESGIQSNCNSCFVFGVSVCFQTYFDAPPNLPRCSIHQHRRKPRPPIPHTPSKLKSPIPLLLLTKLPTRWPWAPPKATWPPTPPWPAPPPTALGSCCKTCHEFETFVEILAVQQ